MKTSLSNPNVSVFQGPAFYNDYPPYNPGHNYPEYPFDTVNDQANPAYVAVRESFHLLGMDEANFGLQAWNPLGDLISPGDRVIVKPNLIRESHGTKPDLWKQVITHGSIIRAVLDYVYIALHGWGKVIIADGPQTDSDWDLICERDGLLQIVGLFRDHGLDIDLLDLRRDRWYQKGDVIYRRETLPGDPAGYTTVDLGKASCFRSYSLNGHFYGADYNAAETAKFHSDGRHAYVLCRSVMDADVVINLPKMKTHKKTGVTLSLKNIVGINGYRNSLPHHTMGTHDEGGDEFSVSDKKNKFQSRAIVVFKWLLTQLGGNGGAWARLVQRVGKKAFGSTERVVRSGNWHGNDTTWRMVLDLNQIFFYFNGEGNTRSSPKRYLTLMDGIIAGEGNGPSTPDPNEAGLVIAGFNPVAVDTVGASLMGFDYRRIKMIVNAWDQLAYPLCEFSPEQITCRSTRSEWNGPFTSIMNAPHLAFLPHFGWKGAIERSVQMAQRAT